MTESSTTAKRGEVVRCEAHNPGELHRELPDCEHPHYGSPAEGILFERRERKDGVGTTRRIIMDGATQRSHLEIERSHIDGKAARLTATLDGTHGGTHGGVILHMTEVELARLVSAGLRLLARNGGDVTLALLDDTTDVTRYCAHCGTVVERMLNPDDTYGTGQWYHVGAAGFYRNCGDTVTSGTLATPMAG